MSRAEIIRSLVARIGDYRDGDIAPIDAGHINRWVSQFEAGVQVPILTELDHVLARTYFRRSAFENYFAEVVTNADIVGVDPRAFWAQSRFFNQQQRGGSQHALLEMFSSALQQECDLSVDECGDDEGPLVYVDDAVYTGMHVLNDLTPIIDEASPRTNLYIIVLGLHSQGKTYAAQQLRNRFRAANKTVNIRWFCLLNLENASSTNSDVLWPKSLPNHVETREYAASLAHQIVYRRGDSTGRNGFFSSAEGRDLLEQEFLKAGALIRSGNQNLNRFARPLGNLVLEGFGFGALVVTYRNCANNCPLVFWAGDHPLFERDNN